MVDYPCEMPVHAMPNHGPPGFDVLPCRVCVVVAERLVKRSVVGSPVVIPTLLERNFRSFKTAEGGTTGDG